MIKKFLLGLNISLISFFPFNAYAYDLTQLIIEKKVEIDRKSGYIITTNLDQVSSSSPKRTTLNASEIKKVNITNLKSGVKTYSIVNEKNSFSSLISVKDGNGNEIKRISVGRQAIKLISAPKSKNLFVLCGGYFGSVWEINTTNDMVVKKYSTSWNPTDISLDSSEKFLYVTSGKLQKFSLESDVVFEIEIPSEVRYLKSVMAEGFSGILLGAIDKEGLDKKYKLSNFSNKIFPDDGSLSFQEQMSVSIESDITVEDKISDLFIIYSKNNDFIYLFSLITGAIKGIIPLDSKADEVLYASKLNKIFVLHRLIGQISVIDITPSSNTKFSVVTRILDDRLKDLTNKMVFDENKVFIKSDSVNEGYIDSENVLRFTYPIVEVPFNKDKESFEISSFAEKRYLLKNNQLFFENIGNENLNYSRKVKISSLGNTVGGISVSSDGKTLFATDFSSNMLLGLDTSTNRIISRNIVGNHPTEVISFKNYVYVLNQAEQTISTVDLNKSQVVNTSRLKIENNSLNIIKLYDSEFDQIVKVYLTAEPSKELSVVKVYNQE